MIFLGAVPDPATGVAYYVVFLFSVTLHEAAHAWAALKGGDATAYHGGQVSLDPMPHIRREPFGMIIMPILTVLLTGWPFGFASAPYDPFWAARYPKRAALMALAGPASNLLLAGLAFGAMRLGLSAGVFGSPQAVSFDEIIMSDRDEPWRALSFLLGVFFSLNLLFFVFNLIPLPPLDGSAAVPLLLSPRATERYQELLWGQPALQIVGIVIAWRLFWLIFDPIWLFAVNLLHPGANYG